MSIFANKRRFEDKFVNLTKTAFFAKPGNFVIFGKFLDFFLTNQNDDAIGTYTARRDARPARICSHESQLSNAEKTNILRSI